MDSDMQLQPFNIVQKPSKGRIIHVAGQGFPLNYLSGWDFVWSDDETGTELPSKATLTLYFFREAGRPFFDITGQEAEQMFEWLENNYEKFF